MANAVLSIEDRKINMEIKRATLGSNCMDISGLLKEDIFALDPGFTATASCESKITYIDGDNGILLYRGYPIEQLTEAFSFCDIFYLLLFGDLPSKNKSVEFDKKLVEYMELQPSIAKVIEAFDKNSHPMSIIIACIANISASHHMDFNPKNKDSILEQSIQAVAQTAYIAGLVNRHISGLKHIAIDKNLNFVQNFLHVMFTADGSDYQPNPIIERTFDKILVLHADHEQNASTSTVRLVGSTEANIYASIIAGFSALWGPIHGGANEAVITMLDEIGDVKNVQHYVDRAKDKTSGFRLMGFGHRVYKNYDPRAAVLKSSCDQTLASLGVNKSKSLEIAIQLETIALSDEYFISRKLFPNVDFYSGIIYRAAGIKSSFFTALFGVARTAGWTSQLFEMLSDPARRISRPRQLYTGEKRRDIPKL